MARRTNLPKRFKGIPTSIVFPPDMLEWLNRESIRLGIPRSMRIKMCVKREMDFETGKGPK